MADTMVKKYLDFEGLALYDQKIKELIKNSNLNIDEIKNFIGQLPEDTDAETVIEYLEGKIADVDAKVGDISELTSETVTDLAGALAAELDRAAKAEEAIEQRVDTLETAVGVITKDAPEAFDTLKEIADWISEDETGTAALINRVAKNEDDIATNVDAIAANKEAIEANADAIAENKEAIETNTDAIAKNAEDIAELQNICLERFENIESIEKMKILSLFAVAQSEDVSAAEAISALKEDEAIVLSPEQTITEDIVIDKSCYIDANGSTFDGKVTITSADFDVMIENAQFSNPVEVL